MIRFFISATTAILIGIVTFFVYTLINPSLVSTIEQHMLIHILSAIFIINISVRFYEIYNAQIEVIALLIYYSFGADVTPEQCLHKLNEFSKKEDCYIKIVKDDEV